MASTVDPVPCWRPLLPTAAPGMARRPLVMVPGAGLYPAVTPESSPRPWPGLPPLAELQPDAFSLFLERVKVSPTSRPLRQPSPYLENSSPGCPRGSVLCFSWSVQMPPPPGGLLRFPVPEWQTRPHHPLSIISSQAHFTLCIVCLLHSRDRCGCGARPAWWLLSPSSAA